MTSLPRFHELTIEQQEAVCNGCGSKARVKIPFTPWSVRVPVPQFQFGASCDHHDYGYWKGGDANDRRWCDAKFLGAMVTDAVLLPLWKRPLHITLAWVYYWAVRVGGEEHFNYGGRMTLEDLENHVLAYKSAEESWEDYCQRRRGKPI